MSSKEDCTARRTMLKDVKHTRIKSVLTSVIKETMKQTAKEQLDIVHLNNIMCEERRKTHILVHWHQKVFPPPPQCRKNEGLGLDSEQSLLGKGIQTWMKMFSGGKSGRWSSERVADVTSTWGNHQQTSWRRNFRFWANSDSWDCLIWWLLALPECTAVSGLPV